MKQIMTLLIFTSLGAIITMFLLPPLPVAHTNRYNHRDHPLQKITQSKIYRDWETEPIIGYTVTQEMMMQDTEYHRHPSEK